MILTLKALLEKPLKMKYLLFPLIPKGSVVVIGAPAKSLKSWLAMNLAYGLAAGEKFLDWEVDGQHKVLYLEQEIGRWGVADRFGKIHDTYRSIFAEDNLLIHPKSREPLSLVPDSIGFNHLLKMVEEIDPDVIVLDPLREFHLLDEDNSTAMTKVFQSISALQGDEDRRRTIIVVHHAGKRNEFRSRRDPESLRGSSKIFDAGDSYMMVEAGVANPHSLTLNFKFRHAANILPVTVLFKDKSGTFEVVKRKEEKE